MKKLLTCRKCHWVHTSISKRDAETEIFQFKIFYNRLTQERQMEWFNGKPATLAMYKECFKCGNHYLNFRPTREEDAPEGTSLGHIIDKNEP